MSERATTVPGVRVRDVLSDADFFGDCDVVVTGCCADARQCRPGDALVILPSVKGELHELVATAERAGAVAVISDRTISDSALSVCYVTDSRGAYARLCQALAGHPSQQLKIIGITGSRGKSATSHLIASVLCEGNYASGILGALGYFDGCQWGEAPWTTPTPPVMASWLRSMAANGCTHAVLELSSHALAHSRTAGIDFDVACMTNLRGRRSAIDPGEHYPLASARLFEQLTPEGFAVLNADDDSCLDYLERLDGPVLTIGIERAAELQATPIEQHLSEQTYLLSAGSMTLPVRTKLIGRQNIYNGLVAAAVGLVYGMELPAIVRGLEQVEAIAGRLERIECGQPYGVFVDAACTGESLAEALETLRGLCPGRLLCVCGADANQDRSQRARLGRAAEAGADVAVVTNQHSRHEEPKRIVRDVLRGFERPESAHVMPDRRYAIGWALDQAKPGDCVLISGLGHQTHQLVGHERLEFDDREVAREWLQNATSVRFDRRAA